MTDANKQTDTDPQNDPQNDPMDEPLNNSAAHEAEPAQNQDAQGRDNPVPDSLIAQLEERVRTQRERTMRALADAENTRRRAVKDREDAGKYAIAKFAKSLLDFSDNFTRAVDSIPADLKDGDARVKSVVEGIEAMQRELQSVFDQHGVKKIKPLDEPFDANYHEVMFEAPRDDKAAGTIIQVIEAGYVLNDRLLRAAKVGVAKAGAPDPQTATDTAPKQPPHQSQKGEPGGRIDQKA